MTKPREPRRAASYSDDEWRPGEKARMMRRLFNKLTEDWTPEMRAEERRLHAAKRAAAKPD
ncbi:MAG: hypothetical protein IT546_06960 [Caulobacteraceae bacterium]|nr:hypothetical protein [Caulobacteraceae bacterium]